MIQKQFIEKKLKEINRLRTIEYTIGLDAFQRGQLSGVQQTLAFLAFNTMEPVYAILTDEQLKAMGKKLEEKWLEKSN